MNSDPLITYLATHDAPCPGCYRNLRGQTEKSCPACGARLELSSVRAWHEMHGDALTNPMPVPGSPESVSAEAYLAKFNAKCLGCGYNLLGLRQSNCPECAREVRLQEFAESPTPKYQKDAVATGVVVLNLIPLVPTILGYVYGAMNATQYDARHATFYTANLIFSIGVAWLLVTRVKRLFRRSLLYFVAINPITIIAALFFVSMALGAALFG